MLPEVYWELDRLALPKRYPNHVFRPYGVLRQMEEKLRKKKGFTNGNSGYANRDTGGGDRGGQFVFCNLPLSDADLVALEQSEVSMEFLAARLFAIFGDGASFAMRHVDSGESVCCTIHRPDSGNAGVVYGYSSFGASEYDAALVAVYRFDIHLEGSFDNIVRYAPTAKQERRFR